jgi:hypothetical protein
MINCLLAFKADNGIGFIPKISIESLFGSFNMDSALSLGGSIFVDKAHKSSFSLKTVTQPFSFVALELEVLEGH